MRWNVYAGTRSWRRRCISSVRCFDHVNPAFKDPITRVTEAFLADSNPNKINLGVGAYRDDEGKPVVLQCVHEAEKRIAGSQFLESVSAAVNSKMVEESCKLIYGVDSEFIRERRFAAIQALSGTGACRLFAEFQRRFYPESQIYLPNPTWSNHHNIWGDAKVPRRNFSYYDLESKGLNFQELIDDIKKAPEGSFFLLHPCAHNPTGIDPSEEQWREISVQLKVGMFCYSGLKSEHIDRLAREFHVYLTSDGRISIAGVTKTNVGYLANAIHEVTKLDPDC